MAVFYLRHRIIRCFTFVQHLIIHSVHTFICSLRFTFRCVFCCEFCKSAKTHNKKSLIVFIHCVHSSNYSLRSYFHMFAPLHVAACLFVMTFAKAANTTPNNHGLAFTAFIIYLFTAFILIYVHYSFMLRCELLSRGLQKAQTSRQQSTIFLIHCVHPSTCSRSALLSVCLAVMPFASSRQKPRRHPWRKSRFLHAGAKGMPASHGHLSASGEINPQPQSLGRWGALSYIIKITRTCPMCTAGRPPSLAG